MHVSDLRHSNKTLQEKLEKLYAQRTRSRVNWDAEGYKKLLHSMGDPHLRLPPVIHVAGTNGKGSIVAFLKAMFEAEGYRVHAYTSPHLQRVNERFYIAGAEIEDDYLEALIDEAQAQHNLADLSFFEITTAIAFKAFADNPADVLLLEVGMGGRLDCTNIIENPSVTVISRVSRDHTEFLGEDIAQIAAEKAGIIKRGCSCVLGAQGDAREVFEVVEKIAGQAEVPLYAFGRDWQSFSQSDEMILEFNGRKEVFPVPALQGEHQIYNAGAAVVALRLAEKSLPVSRDSILRGLKTVQWRGRLQPLRPVSLGLPAHTQIWLDSGHNDSAGAVLADVVTGWTAGDPRPVRLVLGMLGHKDVRGFLKPLAGLIDEIYLCGIQGETQGLEALKLEESVGDLFSDINIRVFDKLGAVFEAIREAESQQAARVLIAGSVYLAGDVLSLIDSRASAGSTD